MRILTSGESHGECLLAILEGFPKGVKIEKKFIDDELKRRRKGTGRGRRMEMEEDKVEIVSGLRKGITLGSPIGLLIKNKDHRIFTQKGDRLKPIFVPRPAHADLEGAIKYQEKDIRNIWERASARETAMRVGVGAICKQFLLNFDIRIVSFVIQVGRIFSSLKPKNVREIEKKIKKSSLNCLEPQKEKLMIREIEKAQKEGDTLGGIIEVWAEGLPPGLGSFMHFDQRLDARLAQVLMSIPGVKGVEIGLGFEYASGRGSHYHDVIYYHPRKGFYRKTNNSGGVEGGISTGEPLILRIGLKPIATLKKPLPSVNLLNKRVASASVLRSDVCVVASCGVIGESMVAIVLTEAMLEKFGCDSLKEITTNYRNYLEEINSF